MRTLIIDGKKYSDMLRAGAQNLNANRAVVNDLNVFPIPDGDTGDNMYMTISSGANKSGGSDLLGDVAAVSAREMLLGARGNSGVILSRIFSGIAKGLSGVKEADTRVFSKALRSGVKEAYSAVSVPVEGTILTVYREAVESTSEHSVESFEEFFDSFIREARESLKRTPDLLDVLKEAGVVDSGGAGFIYIAEGMKAALSGIEFEDIHVSESGPRKPDLNAFTEDSVLEFGYCTEFLLRLQKSKTDIDNFDLDNFIKWLNSVGDSVVAFREGTIIKVHVHTKTPGNILNHCQLYGEFLTTKIENMTLQHNETHPKPAKEAAEKPEEFYVEKPKKDFGIVSVAAGEGIREIFSSLGCDVVVDGGQSMNPSAEDLLDAYEKANAHTVFVFPNNSNIVLTAMQAASLCEDTDVRIIKTKTIGEGYSAISMFDTTIGGADEIEANLNEIISDVVTGMVSRASRDTEYNGIEVRKDDYIGFVDDTIYIDEEERKEAVTGLCEKLNAGDFDIMLVLVGDSVSKEESESVYAKLKDAYKRTEVILLDGGQPVYDYIIILE